jgi:hypothetical protein
LTSCRRLFNQSEALAWFFVICRTCTGIATHMPEFNAP